MKKFLFFALPVFVMMVSSCVKNNDVEETPYIAPVGKFTGNFTRYRARFINNKYVYDTTRVSGLVLNLTSTTYKTTGDTSIHAGSKGLYFYDRQLMEYRDSTVKAGTNSINLPKPHLNGVFVYNYDGTSLNFSASNDTLLYLYQLKKTN
jgi:hypothetical protein